MIQTVNGVKITISANDKLISKDNKVRPDWKGKDDLELNFQTCTWAQNWVEEQN